LIDFVLPEWIPENDWNDWLAIRKAKRAPTTIGAMNRAVKNLERLRAEGHAPADVLQQSTLNAWTDVYPIKQPYANTNGKSNGAAPTAAKPTNEVTPEQLERERAAHARAYGY
jgi:hypothetical protein